LSRELTAVRERLKGSEEALVASRTAYTCVAQELEDLRVAYAQLEANYEQLLRNYEQLQSEFSGEDRRPKDPGMPAPGAHPAVPHDLPAGYKVSRNASGLWEIAEPGGTRVMRFDSQEKGWRYSIEDGECIYLLAEKGYFRIIGDEFVQDPSPFAPSPPQGLPAVYKLGYDHEERQWELFHDGKPCGMFSAENGQWRFEYQGECYAYLLDSGCYWKFNCANNEFEASENPFAPSSRPPSPRPQPRPSSPPPPILPQPPSPRVLPPQSTGEPELSPTITREALVKAVADRLKGFPVIERGVLLEWLKSVAAPAVSWEEEVPELEAGGGWTIVEREKLAKLVCEFMIAREFQDETDAKTIIQALKCIIDSKMRSTENPEDEVITAPEEAPEAQKPGHRSRFSGEQSVGSSRPLSESDDESSQPRRSGRPRRSAPPIFDPSRPRESSRRGSSSGSE
jgi:hypothetical protein